METQEWSAPFGCGGGSAPLDAPFMGGDRIGKVLQPEQALMSKVAKKFPSCLERGGFVNVRETNKMATWAAAKR